MSGHSIATKLLRPLAVAAVLVLLVAACSSSDGDDETASTATAAPTADATPIATAVPTAAATSTAAPTATVAPTATAAPTATVAPTATPEPEPEPEPVLYYEPGPYSVGVKTLVREGFEEHPGEHLIEVWYPADEEAVKDMQPEKFLIASTFPSAFVSLLPAALQESTFEALVYRDAPHLVGTHPVVLFEHAPTQGRFQGAWLGAHLASWGMAMVSIDHPNLEFQFVADQGVSLPLALENLREVKQALEVVQTELDHVTDLSKIGTIGHSFAGVATALEALELPRVITAIVISPPSINQRHGWPTEKLTTTETPVMFIAGEQDIIFPPEETVELFEIFEGPRRYVALAGAGHNSFLLTCPPIWNLDEADFESFAAILAATGPGFDRTINGCTPDSINPEHVQAAVKHLATAHFLHEFGIAEAQFSPEYAASAGVEVVEYRAYGMD